MKRLICWFKGHKRGKFVRGEGDLKRFNVFACPRCGRETKYKR